MPALAPFLPPHMVGALQASKGRCPSTERLRGALLLSDIAGFTSLTERLQKTGRGGAEQVAAIVSRTFRPAIRAIEAHGGSIVVFGGDSIFSVFLGGGAVGCAAAAAAEIESSFSRSGSRPGAPRLGITQAIHHGVLRGMHLEAGDERHYVVAGPAVRAVARLLARAPRGTTVLSREARRHAGGGQGRSMASGAPRLEGPWLAPYVPAPVRELRGRFEGEYRVVAVAFAELRPGGRDGAGVLFRGLTRILATYDGLLLKSDVSADGIRFMLVFGLPRSHEDVAERAARAALEVLSLASGPRTRLGIHDGVVANVVVGTASRRSFDVMGDVVNTAARVMGQAAWGEALVSDGASKRLREVRTAPAGERRLKGKAAPERLHRLDGTAPRAAIGATAGPLVGRGPEMARLHQAVEDLAAGKGSVLWIVGDAGVGKSRLKWEAARLAASRGIPVAEGCCRPFGGGGYGPTAALLRQCLGLGPAAGGHECLAALGSVEGLDGRRRALLADVLGVAAEGASGLEGRARRDATLAALSALLLEVGKSGARMLVLEDLHWADELTRGVVEVLAAGAPAAPILLLLLSRPGYVPPAGAGELRLGELSATDVAALLSGLLGNVAAPLATLVHQRCEGNPLYVEELVRHMQELGVVARGSDGFRAMRELGSEDLPPSIESLIEARLGTLSPGARRAAQCGAVLGRSFAWEVVARMPGVDAAGGGALRELAARGLVFENRLAPGEYIFKHVLTRDVAYGTILSSSRRRLHRVAAEALQARDDGGASRAIEGHHWEEAGDARQAQRCYSDAADRALSIYALDEGERLLRRYLSLERRASVGGVDARNRLGVHVLQQRGRMEEADAEHQRALRDSRRIGSVEAELESLRNVALVALETGRPAAARSMLERCVPRAREAGGAPETMVLSVLAAALSEEGHVDEARAIFEQVLASCRARRDARNAGAALGNLAIQLHRLARYRDAEAAYREAADLARETGNRRLEGLATGNLAGLLMAEERRSEAGPLLRRAIEIAVDIGNRRGEAVARHNLAELYSEDSEPDRASSLFREAMAIWAEVGDRRTWAVAASGLAHAALAAGRLEEARHAFEDCARANADAGEVGRQARALVSLSALQRHLGIERSAAAAHALELEARDPDVETRVMAWCERGHWDLRDGRRPDAALGSARAAAGADGAGRASLERLERAAARFEAGLPLVGGDCPEDVPRKAPPSESERAARISETGEL